MEQNFISIKFRLAKIQKVVHENKCHCMTSNGSAEIEENVLETFPLATIEDVEKVELFLKNKAFKSKLVC